MAPTTTRSTHVPTAANVTNSAVPGTTAGVPANSLYPALHLRSFVAGVVLALLLTGAATLALRWTPAPALVLHAPPAVTVQPAVTAAAAPTTVARGLGLPTPTLSAGSASAASPPAALDAASASTAPVEGVPSLQTAPVNLNTATAAELEALPGIGPAKAQAIIAHRPYNTVEDLDGVPGIGPATLARLRQLVVVE